MTVPKSERDIAPSEFVIESMRVLDGVESLARKLPKRWSATGDDLVACAKNISRSCVKADSVYAASVPEYDYRLRLLNAAYTECNYLAGRLVVAYRKHPVTYRTETLPNRSVEQVEEACFTEKKLNTLSTQIDKLRALLRGQIETFRDYRMKQIKKEASWRTGAQPDAAR